MGPAVRREAGAHNVTVHAEAAADPVMLARDLRAAGALAGLAIKPGTPLEPYLELLRGYDTLLVMTVEPASAARSSSPTCCRRSARPAAGSSPATSRLAIEVDGGINADTIVAAAEAGADVFVAGSAVFHADDPDRAVRELRELARKAY